MIKNLKINIFEIISIKEAYNTDLPICICVYDKVKIGFKRIKKSFEINYIKPTNSIPYYPVYLSRTAEIRAGPEKRLFSNSLPYSNSPGIKAA
jgi:hypothetical protein